MAPKQTVKVGPFKSPPPANAGGPAGQKLGPTPGRPTPTTPKTGK